ncbi:MAG: glucose-6-phosphate isomerase family protein [Chloroflexota bacterium]
MSHIAKSLADWAGIPITWNETGDEIRFDPSLTVKETKSRLRGQLRPVLPNDAAIAPAEAIQYWMYNGISLPQHAQAFADLGIQYELTLLYPSPLGNEYSKTLGHIHTYPAHGTLNYAEVCEVLWGEAIFYFQTLNAEAKSAPFCYAVRAKQGDKVVFPPNTHHLTINASDEMLLFSDFISIETRGDYDGLSAMGGAAYHCTKDGWTPNPRYASVAELEVFDAEDYPAAHLSRTEPLYAVIERAPESLRWLDDPEMFGAVFPEVVECFGDALNLTP